MGNGATAPSLLPLKVFIIKSLLYYYYYKQQQQQIRHIDETMSTLQAAMYVLSPPNRFPSPHKMIKCDVEG